MSVRSRRNMRFAIANLARGPSYDAEAAAYFSAAGITNAGFKSLMNALIVGLKTDWAINALTDKMNHWLQIANESATAAVVDVTGRGHNGSLINNPTFAQWSGVARAGSTDYVDSGFNPSTMSAVGGQNDHCYAHDSVATPTSNSYAWASIDGGFSGHQMLPNLGGTSSNYFATDGAASYNASVGGVGFYMSNRSAANSWLVSKNDVTGGTSGSAGQAAVNQNIFLLARNFAGSPDQGGAQTGSKIGFWAATKALTAGERTALFNRYQTFKTGLASL